MTAISKLYRMKLSGWHRDRWRRRLRAAVLSSKRKWVHSVWVAEVEKRRELEYALCVWLSGASALPVTTLRQLVDGRLLKQMLLRVWGGFNTDLDTLLSRKRHDDRNRVVDFLVGCRLLGIGKSLLFSPEDLATVYGGGSASLRVVESLLLVALHGTTRSIRPPPALAVTLFTLVSSLDAKSRPKHHMKGSKQVEVERGVPSNGWARLFKYAAPTLAVSGSVVRRFLHGRKASVQILVDHRGNLSLQHCGEDSVPETFALDQIESIREFERSDGPNSGGSFVIIFESRRKLCLHESSPSMRRQHVDELRCVTVLSKVFHGANSLLSFILGLCINGEGIPSKTKVLSEANRIMWGNGCLAGHCPDAKVERFRRMRASILQPDMSDLLLLEPLSSWDQEALSCARAISRREHLRAMVHAQFLARDACFVEQVALTHLLEARIEQSMGNLHDAYSHLRAAGEVELARELRVFLRSSILVPLLEEQIEKVLRHTGDQEDCIMEASCLLRALATEYSSMTDLSRAVDAINRSRVYLDMLLDLYPGHSRGPGLRLVLRCACAKTQHVLGNIHKQLGNVIEATMHYASTT